MKTEQKLKVALIVLLIILISLISFGGIFIKKGNMVNNILPDYNLGMDLTGSRLLGLKVSDSTTTVIYDKDGNVVEEEGEGTTTKEEPINPEETLTKENYQMAKNIIDSRLKKMEVQNYTIRFNEENGEMYVQLPEDSQTDRLIQYFPIRAKFEMVDTETDEALLTGDDLEGVYWGYNTTEQGTVVYLSIKFNEQGKEIFKNITNTYTASTTDEGEEAEEKTISIKIDESVLLSTHFDEEITDGVMQLYFGQPTTSSETLLDYSREASTLAVLLNSGTMPVTYSVFENTHIASDISGISLTVPIIIAVVLLIIGIVWLVVRYKQRGILVGLSLIGYIAIYLLIIRFINIVITLEGISGIVIAVILNYIFTIYLLHLLKGQDIKTKGDASKGFKEAMLKALFILVPVIIISVVLCFAGWEGTTSFGTTIFWGILISFLYHLGITRSLIVASTKNK